MVQMLDDKLKDRVLNFKTEVLKFSSKLASWAWTSGSSRPSSPAIIYSGHLLKQQIIFCIKIISELDMTFSAI